VRISRRASLLVVGHAANGRPNGRSVATRVAARAEVPVLVYRPVDVSTSVPLPRPVLVGLAGISGSESQVEFAFTEAALRGAPLVALHVWSEPAAYSPFGTGPEGSHSRHARDDAELVLIESLSAWSDKYPDVTVRHAVRHCLDVGVALTAASRSAQLVVVGAPAAPPGTVLPVLLHRAGCPVAVVPAG
jgi:hypothetical protein